MKYIFMKNSKNIPFCWCSVKECSTSDISSILNYVYLKILFIVFDIAKIILYCLLYSMINFQDHMLSVSTCSLCSVTFIINTSNNKHRNYIQTVVKLQAVYHHTSITALSPHTILSPLNFLKQ